PAQAADHAGPHARRRRGLDRTAGAGAGIAHRAGAAKVAAVIALNFTTALPAASPEEPPVAEVQINLCAPPEEILRRLSLSTDPDRRREIWYFESPTLEEYVKGIVFRLRLGANERRLTVKARIADCAQVDASLLRAAGGKCEADVHGEKMQIVASLEADLDEKTVRGLLDGRVSLPSALSPAQGRYLQAAGPWPLSVDLRPLGPIRVDS